MGTPSVSHQTCAKSTLADRFNSSLTLTKNLVLIALVVATSAFALAADEKANSSPCKVNAADAAGLTGDLSTNIHALDDYMGTVTRLLNEGKIDELDCIADHARSGKERFSGGTWKLHTLYTGLANPIQPPATHATKEDWNALLQRLQHWVVARPKSITARVALATAYEDFAWAARGNGYADTVSDGGQKAFEERTVEAKKTLDEASALTGKDAEWYLAMQSVAQSQGWDKDTMRALFEEASKFEPGYYYYARMLANALQPKWSGEPGDSEKFVQETADRIGGDEGDILYFQVGAKLICGCEDEPQLSMERMRRGFEASEKHYGVSMLNLNKIAFVASFSKAPDAVVADKAFSRIGDQWDKETWQTKESFDAEKMMMANVAKQAVKVRAAEAAAQANLQTAEGARYQVVFEKAYKAMFQECVRTDGATVEQWQGKFETMTNVGPKGSSDDGWVNSMGPVVMCTYRKMKTSYQDKSALFPPPPQGGYWVKLDLDWADFAPVAAK